jgi:hypothetical protein
MEVGGGIALTTGIETAGVGAVKNRLKHPL